MNIWDRLNNTCCSHKEFHPSQNQTSFEDYQRIPPPHMHRSSSQARDNSLAEVLGLKTVEKVKDLCRAYGIRTTRAGTNGGRKAKSELINDLLAAGVTRIDDGFVKSVGKEKRKRTAPSAMPAKRELAAALALEKPTPGPVAAAVVVVAPPPVDMGVGRLDSLAEIACLALMEMREPKPPATYSPQLYQPFVSLAHEAHYQEEEPPLSWEQVKSQAP